MNKLQFRVDRVFGFSFLTISITIILAFLVGPVTAKQSSGISYREIPDWVLDAPIPETNPKRSREVDDGIYYLIDDTQIKIDNSNSQRFYRLAHKAVERVGLEEAAQFQLTFEPSMDELILHRAAVWRSGKLIDQTSSASVEILRREGELEEGIITGNLTASVRLDDVRVGDVTDIAWSLRARKSYWPGHFFGRYNLGWAVPVALTRLRVIAPKSSKISIRNTNEAPVRDKVFDGENQVLTWTAVDPDPIPSESGTPKWIRSRPTVELSTMPKWSEVVNWAKPFYDVDQSLPSDLNNQIDAIAASSDDPKVRTTKALWLVQDSIRYTSISIGTGGFRPRAPRITWESGFGDCKDKTALLIAVLARLDISATPALTDIDTGPGLNELQPRADAFDHVIVRVDGLGKPIWLDPTGSHQGGIIPNIADQTYGFALPLKNGQTKLEKIPIPAPNKPTIEIIESHVRSDEGIKIEIVTTYKNDEANIQRSNIASSSLSSIEQNWVEFYEEMYPGIQQKGQLVIKDNREKNILVVEKDYFLAATADDYKETILSYQIYAWAVDDLYSTAEATKRRTPFSLPYQINRRHVINLTTPGMRPDLPDDEIISNNAFDFERSSNRIGDELSIEMTLVGKATVLETADFSAYRKDAERLEYLSYEYIDLDDELGTVGSLLLIAALSLYFIGGSVLLYKAVQSTKVAEENDSATGQFHPVGLSKFIILNAATLGFYSIYWFWRCWRRYRQVETADIMPFWRAVFSIFWVFPLFKAANGKTNAPKPIWLGILITVIYVACAAVSGFAERIELPFAFESAAIVIGFLILLPLLKQINLANKQDKVSANGVFYPRHWAIVLCGTPFSAYYLLFSI